MKSGERRQEILSLLGNTDNPIPANVLKERFKVSRQVIVQDIALLRANGYDITSTNRGYLLNTKAQATRVFKCRHSFEELVEEGELIISLGGRIEDIFVNHRVYGRISARLDLNSRMHVEELYRSLFSGASKPLMSVTDGYHYHTVSAGSEERLDEIERALRGRGFLIEI
ncbi:MAG: transcription repressor NadR [Ruminococcus flavefaciens]|nr:transcription repressor NadR [Ruminococcus flavefaciens]